MNSVTDVMHLNKLYILKENKIIEEMKIVYTLNKLLIVYSNL